MNENSVLVLLKVNNREGPIQLWMTSAHRSMLAAASHSNADKDCVKVFSLFFTVYT